MKDFKLESMAAKVDRMIFPILFKRMLDRVLLPEHLIGGFRGTGIFVLLIGKQYKLKTSSALAEVVDTTSDTRPQP